MRTPEGTQLTLSGLRALEALHTIKYGSQKDSQVGQNIPLLSQREHALVNKP